MRSAVYRVVSARRSGPGAGLRYDFGSGVPIPSGAALCIDTNSATAVLGAHFHGYLVRER